MILGSVSPPPPLLLPCAANDDEEEDRDEPTLPRLPAPDMAGWLAELDRSIRIDYGRD